MFVPEGDGSCEDERDPGGEEEDARNPTGLTYVLCFASRIVVAATASLPGLVPFPDPTATLAAAAAVAVVVVLSLSPSTALNPMEVHATRLAMICSRPENDPPHMKRMFVVSIEINSPAKERKAKRGKVRQGKVRRPTKRRRGRKRER